MPMRHVVGEVPLGGSPWPPIASYAFLSDCEVGVLVAPTGNVEWMCLPARPRRRRLPALPRRH
jgi:alpha,alpha-trehalase